MITDLDEAIKVLASAANHETVRLKRGVMKRQEIALALAEGRTPEGPRVDWILKTANKLLDTLQQSAREFNDENQDDLISIMDLVDVCATAQTWLQNGSKTKV